MDAPRGGPSGSRLSEATRRAILMLKEANPDWGCERIAALLLRGPALAASPHAVARVLHEAGYELEERGLFLGIAGFMTCAGWPGSSCRPRRAAGPGSPRS